jgi:phthalate 4,5-cis-dihydrodiol dehydrogenase
MTSPSSKPIGLGIAGWGAAGRLMAEAVTRSKWFSLVGVADVDPVARGRARVESGVPIHPTLEELVARPDVQTVYVATPTGHHGEAIAVAAAHGTHIICEKPLAASVADALRAVDVARKAGICLVVGVTHSFDAPVRELRRLVEQEVLGPLLAVESSCHSDWHSRQRHPADLDLASGNGLVLRQGAHQLDILRLVCGGVATSLRGLLIGGVAGAELGFGAQLAFAGGTQASAYYSGTGGFDSRMQSWGVGETGVVDLEPTAQLSEYFLLPGSPSGTSVGPVFGRTVATFARGSVLVTPRGLLVFTREGLKEIGTTDAPSGWDAVLAELRAALDGEVWVHTGEWAAATLELCLAVHQSAETGAPVPLTHQVALPSTVPQENQ